MARANRTTKGAAPTTVADAPGVLSVTPELLGALDPACIDEYGHLRVDATGEPAVDGEHRYRASHIQATGAAGCVVAFRRIALRGGS